MRSYLNNVCQILCCKIIDDWYIKTFGNWTLIGYPLLTTIPILLFGLTEFAIRLPSALSGVIQVVLIYHIAKRMFGKKSIGLFAAFFYALSPWSIYFSRIVYETNLALTFFLAGIYLFVRFFTDKEKKTFYLFSSILLFMLTQFIYYSYALFIPLFVSALVFYYRKYISKDRWTKAALVIFLFFTCLSMLIIVRGSIGELATEGIFQDQTILFERVNNLRADTASEEPLIIKKLHSKFLAVPYQIGQNYINSFSPLFLFDKGGGQILSTLGFFGHLYLFDAFLLFVGGIRLVWKREKTLPVLFLWFLLGPLASAISKDSPSSTRLFAMMPLYILITSYGATQMYDFLKKNKLRLIGFFFLSLLFLCNVFFFIDAYFFHLNTQRARYLHFGYKEIVAIANKYPSHKVVVRGPENFPYISFLFYNRYDPEKFRKVVKRYPVNVHGFDYVKSFDRYEFVKKIDRKQLAEKTLYIDDVKNGDTNVIRLPSGETLFAYFTK